MRTLIIAIFIAFGLASFVSGQEDVAAKHAAYYLCINNIETKPVQAYAYCSAYIKKYPNDDKRLVDFAGMFTTAFEKVDRYLGSVPDSHFIDGPGCRSTSRICKRHCHSQTSPRLLTASR